MKTIMKEKEIEKEKSGVGEWTEKDDNEMCYESPKKELTSHTFEYLIYNLKSYNGVKI